MKTQLEISKNSYIITTMITLETNQTDAFMNCKCSGLKTHEAFGNESAINILVKLPETMCFFAL